MKHFLIIYGHTSVERSTADSLMSWCNSICKGWFLPHFAETLQPFASLFLSLDSVFINTRVCSKVSRTHHHILHLMQCCPHTTHMQRRWKKTSPPEEWAETKSNWYDYDYQEHNRQLWEGLLQRSLRTTESEFLDFFVFPQWTSRWQQAGLWKSELSRRWTQEQE